MLGSVTLFVVKPDMMLYERLLIIDKNQLIGVSVFTVKMCQVMYFFTKILLNPFMNMASKDRNLLHEMITS